MPQKNVYSSSKRISLTMVCWHCVLNHKGVRHWLRRTCVCERSEAIQNARFLMDCFVAALLTDDGLLTIVCWHCVLNLKGVRHCERSEAIHKYGMNADMCHLRASREHSWRNAIQFEPLCSTERFIPVGMKKTTFWNASKNNRPQLVSKIIYIFTQNFARKWKQVKE
jgi:hypothetical protein